MLGKKKKVVDCIPSGLDPFGAVQAGKLTVEALVTIVQQKLEKLVVPERYLLRSEFTLRKRTVDSLKYEGRTLLS